MFHVKHLLKLGRCHYPARKEYTMICLSILIIVVAIVLGYSLAGVFGALLGAIIGITVFIESVVDDGGVK